MADRPTLQEVLAEAMDARVNQIRTAIPADVVYYNRTSRRANIRPMVWPQGYEEPVVEDVPVHWPGAGSSYLAFPLVEGNHGWLMACEADIGQWLRTGEPGAPADQARHHIQSAFFIPGAAVYGEFIDHSAGATILVGTDVRLGSNDAEDHPFKGEDVNTALGVWAGVLQAAIFAAGGPDITANNTTFLNAMAAALASRVKVY